MTLRAACRSLLLLMPIMALPLINSCTTGRIVFVNPMLDTETYVRVMKITLPLVAVMDVVDKDKYSVWIFEAQALEAFALDGHTILVSRGLLTAFNDEELMCVLAHETAHISLGHRSKRVALLNSKSLPFQEVDRVAPDSGLLSRIFKPLAVNKFSQQQELEADMEAVRAVRTFGVSPEVYVKVLLKLKDFADKKGIDTGGGLLDRHPSINARIEKIREITK